MPQYKVCNCPRCNSSGISVGAMHYRETQQWHKSGSFSGSGIGIGTGGIGFGVGGGTYSESGEIATKRANQFAEPGRYQVPILHLILPLFIMLFAINMLPTLINIMQSITNESGQTNTNINLEGLTPFVNFFNYYLAPIYGVFIIFKIFSTTKKAQEEENHLNTVVYPQQLARYNELRYCENCHTLYDHNNHAEDANSLGMEKMMQIAPGL